MSANTALFAATAPLPTTQEPKPAASTRRLGRGLADLVARFEDGSVSLSNSGQDFRRRTDPGVRRPARSSPTSHSGPQSGRSTRGKSSGALEATSVGTSPTNVDSKRKTSEHQIAQSQKSSLHRLSVAEKRKLFEEPSSSVSRESQPQTENGRLFKPISKSNTWHSLPGTVMGHTLLEDQQPLMRADLSPSKVPVPDCDPGPQSGFDIKSSGRMWKVTGKARLGAS